MIEGTLDGTVTFDKKHKLSWGTSSRGVDAIEVWWMRDITDAPTNERIALPEVFTTGLLGPEVVWSGQQVLVLVGDRSKARIMPSLRAVQK